jgi:3-oxoacyl-[acyl-carrier protein] reductase
MDLGLEGKSAIVTGGSMGIGSALALALAREGCDVAINYRRHDQESMEIIKRIREFGRLDIMVCNAGINWDGVIWKMTEEQWDRVITVNLKGYFNYNKAAALVFKEQKSGKIVNISSINGLRGKFGQTNYAASKGGEIAMSKSLARELGKFNVNVNVVAPGMVMTDMASQIPTEFLNKAVDETVLGRIARPEDCADLVTFLCSDRARHITGEVIKVDGGQYI